MKNTYTLFDAVFAAAAVFVYVTAGTVAIVVADVFWGESAFSKALALVVAYGVFLHAFIICIALLRRLFQAPLTEGSFPIGRNPEYMAWGINSVFHGIMISSPFAAQIHFVFYLNRLYLRLMGMTIPSSTMIGTQTTIRQPELIELGEKTVIGIGCTLVAHFSPNRSLHNQYRIRVGSNTLVGAYSLLSPGVRVGDNVVIGHHCQLNPDVEVGDHCLLGPNVFISSRVRIPHHVTIKAHSVVNRRLDIKPGDIIDNGRVIGNTLETQAKEPGSHD